MSSVRKLQPQTQSWPQNKEEYYKNLTTRNQHFISAETQRRLRDVKILIAGCGSTGGACIEALARAGVENFILADNGEYELNNLNRQHAFKENIGQNKAQFHAENLVGINPYVNVKTFTEGLTAENIDSSIQWADIIIDAIDVTSASGIAMKLQLHERSHREQKAVLTALDIGFRQWGRSYDYRDEHLEIFDGCYEAAKAAKHPLKVLFSFVPLSAVPAHSLQLLEDLLTKRDISASQLGCTSDMLSAIIVPAILRFVEYGEVVDGWDMDLNSLAKPFKVRAQEAFRAFFARRRVKRLLDQAL